jgi:hypothetical protein
MYDSPPHCRDITSMVEKKMSGEDQLINRDFNPKQVREHDLLLLTSVKLNLKENEDIKKISTLEFIKSLVNRSNSMFALVT